MRDTGWRSVLTEEEVNDLSALSSSVQNHRDDIRELRREMRGIQDRARKRFIRAVDKDHVSA